MEIWFLKEKIELIFLIELPKCGLKLNSGLNCDWGGLH